MGKNTQPSHTIEMFYDAACPLCIRETHLLQRLDHHKRIRFTNIAAPDFDTGSIGKTQDELMAEMHGRMADGSWVKGVEVFRQLYSAVGFGPVVWMTRLPIINQLLNICYYIFARNRLRLTGRCNGKCAIEKARFSN